MVSARQRVALNGYSLLLKNAMLSNRNFIRVVGAFAAMSALSACGFGGAEYRLELPPDFPMPAIPKDNPLTVEKVELGRRLFYDARLSANATQSCASCHRQAHAFSEPSAVAIGSTGQKHSRNSMALVNAAYGASFTWAHPGITTLEQHMLIPLFGDSPIEMGAGGHEQEILARIEADAEYRRLFADAFAFQRPRISFENISKAIASFVRTLVSFQSPFDRYAYAGDDSALSESQIRGMNLFMSERLECSHCHSGFNFSQFVTHEANTPADNAFHVTGLYYVADDAVAQFDFGVFEVSSNPEDKDMFKAPTLRNIEYSAPYMHDGSLETLEDVLDFYAAGGREIAEGPMRGDGRKHPRKSSFIRGFTLTQQEKQDVVNFLRSLSDERFVTDPRFADPFASRREEREGGAEL
jgi:cytochrome c peroxidase